MGAVSNDLTTQPSWAELYSTATLLDRAPSGILPDFGGGAMSCTSATKSDRITFWRKRPAGTSPPGSWELGTPGTSCVFATSVPSDLGTLPPSDQRTRIFHGTLSLDRGLQMCARILA